MTIANASMRALALGCLESSPCRPDSAIQRPRELNVPSGRERERKGKDKKEGRDDD